MNPTNPVTDTMTPKSATAELRIDAERLLHCVLQ